MKGNMKHKKCKSDQKYTQAKINRKVLAGVYACIGILAVSGASGVYAYSRNGDLFYDLSGSTGIYAQKKDNTLSDASHWTVTCRALSEGTFKKSIKQKKVNSFFVDAKTSDGNLILSVDTGSIVKEYDISDTKGEIALDVRGLDADTWKLAVSHQKAKHISLSIRWE